MMLKAITNKPQDIRMDGCKRGYTNLRILECEECEDVKCEDISKYR